MMKSTPGSHSELTLPDEPVDWSVLDAMRAPQDENDTDIVEEIVALFLGDLPGRVERLTVALDQADAGALVRAAHGLKGSCANVGAIRLQCLCQILEEFGESGDLRGASRVGCVLPAEVARIESALSRFGGSAAA